MIAVILFQINILTLTLFSVFLCGGRKKNNDSGEGDVSLVQPGVQKSSTAGGGVGTSMFPTPVKPMNDDFSVGVPPPHIPLADKSDERTLADIESIQSEKAMIREKKLKMSGGGGGGVITSKIKNPSAKSPAASTSAEGSKIVKGGRSPAR